MLALNFDLGGYTSAFTTASAAEIFWAFFIVAIAVAVLVIGRRPRRRKRTWTYDVPPRPTSPNRAAELYRSSTAGTRLRKSPDEPT